MGDFNGFYYRADLSDMQQRPEPGSRQSRAANQLVIATQQPAALRRPRILIRRHGCVDWDN
jgi:hypothetical protein